MIVVVKANEFKKKLIKVLLYASVVSMFIAYYIHTSKKMKELSMQLKKDKQLSQDFSAKEKKAKTIENIIYDEAQTVVDILGQKYIRSCKVAKKRLVFIIDSNVSIEPMLVRYGAHMLVKYEKHRTLTAVDINFILKDKYHEPIKLKKEANVKSNKKI